MDSHIKERLVGAAVLVALGVWLIPWLLDGQDGADRSDQAPESAAGLNLPAPDQAGVNRSEATEIDSGGPESTPQASDLASDLGLSSADVAAPASTAPDRPATAGSVAPEAGDAAGPSASGAAPGSDAPVERASSAASATDATGAWAVQLGSFREPVNARELAVQVGDYGYAASVGDVQIAGVLWHRVRVEGFATRDQAEAARSSLAAHGLDAQVLRGE